MTIRQFIFLTIYFPAIAFGQSKTCNTYYKEVKVSCDLKPYKKLNDTLFAIAPTNCNDFHFDSIANGKWKIYSSDTITLLEIADIKNGQLCGTEINFYNNGQIKFISNSINGLLVSFYSTGKTELDGYYKTVIKKRKYYENVDTSLVFIGTETWFWDNGNLAYKATTGRDGSYVEPEYWSKDGNVIDMQKFYELWYDCK